MFCFSVLYHRRLRRSLSRAARGAHVFKHSLILFGLSANLLAGEPSEKENVKTIRLSPEDRDWKALCDENTDDAPGQTRKAKLSPTARADHARAFYKAYPEDARSHEARKLEAMILARAVFAGDTTLFQQKEDAVNSFLNDKKVPESLKAQLAGLTGFFDALKGSKSQSEISSNLEKHAQKLIKNYPNQPQGYETLLTVANGAEPKLGMRLAKQHSDSAAPTEVKARAHALDQRFAFLGHSLRDLLLKETDLGRGNGKPNKPILLLTWSNSSPASVNLAKELQQLDESKVDIVTLNLDKDVALAKDVGKTFVGFGIYDQAGDAGRVAGSLGVDQDSLLFITDIHGLVSDVQGTQNINTKLAKFSR